MADFYPFPEVPQEDKPAGASVPVDIPGGPTPEPSAGAVSGPGPEAPPHSPPFSTQPPSSAPPPYTAPQPSSPHYQPGPSQSLTLEEERTWAMLAHLSILLNLVTGFLGPVAALIIYLVYKDRSRFVGYHALQSMVFQLIAWVGAGILAAVAWTVSGLLAVILIGCLLMPIALAISLVPLAALVYGVIGALQVNQGQDFRYWLVGDWVRGTLTGV